MRVGILALLAGCEWVFPLAPPADAVLVDGLMPAVCPDDYPAGQSSATLRFKFVDRPSTWRAAQDACVSDTF